MGLFTAAHGWWVGPKDPLPKICQTYPTTGWPVTSEKPLKWLKFLKRSRKSPGYWNGPWKNMKKSLQKLTFTPKWFFQWPYLQFWFLNFCLQRAIIIVCCFTHLFFPFSPVCVHPGKQSLSTGFKGTWKTINWYRNCPGGCQYQLLNCWYISIRQWICVFTEWLSIGNVHIVVSAINGLQSVVGFVVIFVLCHPASSGGFGGPPIYWRWNYNLVDGNDPKKSGKSSEKPWKIIVNF